MLGLLLRLIAFLLFVIAGCGGTLFEQGPHDLVAFGLAAWVLATLLDPVWRPSPLRRE